MNINLDELKPKKTSAEWYEEIKHHTTIIDPDGWDRQNYDFSFNQELITESEFNQRLYRSSIGINKILQLSEMSQRMEIDIDLTITNDANKFQ